MVKQKETQKQKTWVLELSIFEGSVAEIRPLYSSTELNLRGRVLGEVEKKSFIALPGKGGHSRIMPSKLCVPTWRG